MSSDDLADTRRAVDRAKRRFGADIRFPVLSDAERLTIAAYNATDPFNAQLARPITYIIDERGVIRWKFLDIRVGDRIPSAEIINELEKL